MCSGQKYGTTTTVGGGGVDCSGEVFPSTTGVTVTSFRLCNNLHGELCLKVAMAQRRHGYSGARRASALARSLVTSTCGAHQPQRGSPRRRPARPVAIGPGKDLKGGDQHVRRPSAPARTSEASRRPQPSDCNLTDRRHPRQVSRRSCVAGLLSTMVVGVDGGRP